MGEEEIEVDEDLDIDLLCSVTLLLGTDGSVIIDCEGETHSDIDEENLARFLYNISVGAYSTKIAEIFQEQFEAKKKEDAIKRILIRCYSLILESHKAANAKPLVRPTEFFRGTNVR